MGDLIVKQARARLFSMVALPRNCVVINEAQANHLGFVVNTGRAVRIGKFSSYLAADSSAES